MEKYALNDITYNFKPFEIFTPDPDYKVNEKELEKSKFIFIFTNDAGILKK